MGPVELISAVTGLKRKKQTTWPDQRKIRQRRRKRKAVSWSLPSHALTYREGNGIENGESSLYFLRGYGQAITPPSITFTLV